MVLEVCRLGAHSSPFLGLEPVVDYLNMSLLQVYYRDW